MAVITVNISNKKAIEQNNKEFVLEAGTHFAVSSKEAVERFVPYLDEKEVVDLGCGDGAATEYFHEHNIKVIGVDTNPKKLKLNPTETVCEDMITYLESQPFYSIPNIFCHHALEHLPNPQKVLDLISTKLKIGGYIYIEVPANDELHSVHYATFDSQEDIVPPGLELVESCTTDAHYIIARKP